MEERVSPIRAPPREHAGSRTPGVAAPPRANIAAATSARYRAAAIGINRNASTRYTSLSDLGGIQIWLCTASMPNNQVWRAEPQTTPRMRPRRSASAAAPLEWARQPPRPLLALTPRSARTNPSAPPPPHPRSRPRARHWAVRQGAAAGGVLASSAAESRASGRRCAGQGPVPRAPSTSLVCRSAGLAVCRSWSPMVRVFSCGAFLLPP